MRHYAIQITNTTDDKEKIFKENISIQNAIRPADRKS